MTWKKQSKIPIIDKCTWFNKRNINLRKEFTYTSHKRLKKKKFVYIKNNLIDFDSDMYLFDS